MPSQAQVAENYARLLAAITPEEIEALLALDWQLQQLPGEAVGMRHEKPVGFTHLTGALPFLETYKADFPQDLRWLRSDQLAQFLLQNRALCSSYLKLARVEKLMLRGAPNPARVLQVAAEIPGVEAAAFAVFLAARAAQSGDRVLLVDADDKNQFVFSLLAFSELPPVLTENLQKPSSFKSDLARCITKAWPNVDYLNLHATSLRPFNDTELCRICGFLDADYDTVIFYSGRRKSDWLSHNADTTFSFCTPSYKGELAALERHALSPHLVLLHQGNDYYFPWLTAEFRRAVPADYWQSVPPALHVLANFVTRVLSAKRLLFGDGDLGGALNVYNGAALYLRLSGAENIEADKVVNSLQGRLRARYPRDTFFSARSAIRAIARLPTAPVSVLLEIDGAPQLVSLACSPELLATAVFPQGVISALSAGTKKLTAITPQGLEKFRVSALRGHFTEIYSAPRLRFKKPNALAALLEQTQS